MKAILIFTFCFGSIAVFGQVSSKEEVESEANLKVVYAEKEKQTFKIAYFLNRKFVVESIMRTLNPKQIDSINIVKDSIQVENVIYTAQIHIKTKSGYNFNLISLTELKKKHTNLKDKATIFMIDGTIINDDYDKFVIDENFLLTITIDKIENPKQKIDLALVKLLTKSDENIKKSKEIRIRGTEVVLTK